MPGKYSWITNPTLGDNHSHLTKKQRQERLNKTIQSNVRATKKSMQISPFAPFQQQTNQESLELESLLIQAQTEEEREEIRNNFIPTSTIISALNAVDFVMPENLAERALKIATLALNGADTPEIAKELNLHPNTVRAEINRISASRSLALKINPEMGEKVLEATFDVVKCSEELIARSIDILSILQEAITEEFSAAKIDQKDYLQKQAKGWTDSKGMPINREKYPKGISPYTVEAFWHGLEAVGKHQDRIQNILFPMSKQILTGEQNLPQSTVNIINFHSDVLNQAANALLHAAGQVPMPMKPKVIEIEGQVSSD